MEGSGGAPTAVTVELYRTIAAASGELFNQHSLLDWNVAQLAWQMQGSEFNPQHCKQTPELLKSDTPGARPSVCLLLF